MPKRQYTKAALAEAINRVRLGEISQRRASVQYGIPRATIYDKLSGRHPSDFCAMGPAPYLTTEEEAKLAEWAIRMSKSQILQMAQKMVRENGRDTPFKEDKPGRTWFTRFLKRNTPTQPPPEQATSTSTTGELPPEEAVSTSTIAQPPLAQAASSSTTTKPSPAQPASTSTTAQPPLAQALSTSTATQTTPQQALSTSTTELSTIADIPASASTSSRRGTKSVYPRPPTHESPVFDKNLSSNPKAVNTVSGKRKTRKRKTGDESPEAISGSDSIQNQKKRKKQTKREKRKGEGTTGEIERERKSKRRGVKEGKKSKKTPTEEEVDENVCSECQNKIDDDDDVDFLVGCNFCTHWFHLQCTELIGLTREEVEATEFKCFACEQE